MGRRHGGDPRGPARELLPHAQPGLNEGIAQEIAHHLEERVDRLVEEGMSPEDARREAERRFGSVDAIRKEVTAVSRTTKPRRALADLLDEVAQDGRLAVRSALRAPRFTFAVVATLAVGIGANVAMFSVVEGVLLRPLPFRDVDRIVYLNELVRSSPPVREVSVTPAAFLDWEARQAAFESMAALRLGSALVTGDNGLEPVPGGGVTVDYFRVLGADPLLGRTFTRGEDAAGAAVVVVSHRFWVSHLGADPDVLGTSLRLDGKPHTLIGVMRPELSVFRDTSGRVYPIDLWWLGAFPDEVRTDRSNHTLRVVARLAEGHDLERARAEMDAVSKAIADERFDGNEEYGVKVTPFAATMMASVRVPLLVLFGAVAFLLVIAWMNVGNLLLARAETRRAAVALRRSLGATPARLARQLLIEVLLLAAVGSALGVVVAGAALPIIVATSPMRLMRMDGVALDGPVLAFAVLVTFVTAVTTGVVPALRASSWNLVKELKRRSLGSAARTHGAGRATLVVAEVALSLVLLVGAGLLLRTYHGLTRLDLGFEPEGLVSVTVSLPRERYADPLDPREPTPDATRYWRVRPERMELIRRAQAAMSRIPGVSTPVASASVPPLAGPAGRALFWPADSVPFERSASDFVSFRPVSADWFETLGIPLVRGRSFHEEEASGAEDVVIIDEYTAAAFWPGRDPVGRLMVRRDGAVDPTRVFRVVGVARDVRQEVLDNTGEAYDYHVRAAYVPHRQQAETFADPLIAVGLRASFVVRLTGDLAEVAPAIRRAVWAIDPDVPVSVERVADVAHRQLADRRFYSGTFVAFGALGLLLATTGVFAVMSYAVSRKTSELGLRLALGAHGKDLERAELARGASLTALGIGLGCLIAAALGRFLSSFLFHVGPLDPAVYATAGVLLTAASLAAAWLPARRASRVSPLESMRLE